MANWYIFAYTALHMQCFYCACRKSGTVGGLQVLSSSDNTWRLLWLNVKRPWLALVKPFPSFIAQKGLEKHYYHLEVAPILGTMSLDRRLQARTILTCSLGRA